MKLCSISLQAPCPPLPGRAPGEASCFSLPGPVLSLFLSSGQIWLLPQEPGPYSFPQASGTTQLVESLAKEAGVTGKSQPGGLGQALCIPVLPSFPLGGAWLPENAPRCVGHKPWPAQHARQPPSRQSAGSCWGHCLGLFKFEC